MTLCSFFCHLCFCRQTRRSAGLRDKNAWEKIDEAFLRKGRIIGRYCFESLCVEKSNALLQELKSGYQTKTPMTLAEIFNHSEKDFGKMRNRNEVGFAISGTENKN